MVFCSKIYSEKFMKVCQLSCCILFDVPGPHPPDVLHLCLQASVSIHCLVSAFVLAGPYCFWFCPGQSFVCDAVLIGDLLPVNNK